MLTTLYTGLLLEQAVPLSLDQICNIKQPWLQSRLLIGVSSSNEFINRQCTTLMNRSSNRRTFGMAQTTASFRMQLMSSGIVFDHAHEHIMDIRTTPVTVYTQCPKK